jgi:hypothetical protein
MQLLQPTVTEIENFSELISLHQLQRKLINNGEVFFLLNVKDYFNFKACKTPFFGLLVLFPVQRFSDS